MASLTRGTLAFGFTSPLLKCLQLVINLDILSKFFGINIILVCELLPFSRIPNKPPLLISFSTNGLSNSLIWKGLMKMESYYLFLSSTSIFWHCRISSHSVTKTIPQMVTHPSTKQVGSSQTSAINYHMLPMSPRGPLISGRSRHMQYYRYCV